MENRRQKSRCTFVYCLVARSPGGIPISGVCPFFFRASLTRGIVFKIPGTVTRLPRGQRRRNLRQKTRHCSRNTSMSRKRRKSDHHTATGGKFHFFLVVKVDLPSTSQTVLLLYCERSGVAERRLHMTAVFCCGC